MNGRWRHTLAAVGAVACIAATLLAARSPMVPFAPGSMADWTQRLEQLRPQEQERYLELA